MRKRIYIALLLALALIPVRSVATGELLPVEVLQAERTGTEINLRTDTGNEGRGRTVDAAFADMRKRASGEVYLKTVKYLIITEGAEDALQGLKEHLKPDVRVCKGRRGMDITGVAEYLSKHPPDDKLKDVIRE